MNESRGSMSGWLNSLRRMMGDAEDIDVNSEAFRRQVTNLVNKLRIDVYDSTVAKWQEEGWRESITDMEALGRYITRVTGGADPASTYDFGRRVRILPESLAEDRKRRQDVAKDPVSWANAEKLNQDEARFIGNIAMAYDDRPPLPGRGARPPVFGIRKEFASMLLEEVKKEQEPESGTT